MWRLSSTERKAKCPLFVHLTASNPPNCQFIPNKTANPTTAELQLQGLAWKEDNKLSESPHIFPVQISLNNLSSSAASGNHHIVCSLGFSASFFSLFLLLLFSFLTMPVLTHWDKDAWKKKKKKSTTVTQECCVCVSGLFKLRGKKGGCPTELVMTYWGYSKTSWLRRKNAFSRCRDKEKGWVRRDVPRISLWPSLKRSFQLSGKTSSRVIISVQREVNWSLDWFWVLKVSV